MLERMGGGEGGAGKEAFREPEDILAFYVGSERNVFRMMISTYNSTQEQGSDCI